MLVLEELKSLAEQEYKAFNNKIIPTQQTTLGVRLPMLRKIARRIAKEKPMAFIQSDKQNIFELIMLEGMVLSSMDKSFKELLPLTETFLLKVDNWAQIDSSICDFKNITKEKKDVLVVVKKWLKSDKEFFVRAGLVMLLAHFVEKKNLQMIFDLSQSIVHTGYYAHMGNAWLVSCCMAKFPKETIIFFKNNTLDDKTHNKAIQKSRESFRVSKEDKIIINELKRLKR
ncbi:MAG: DNA alkylation repair protein [Pseudomonadota bacterium]